MVDMGRNIDFPEPSLCARGGCAQDRHVQSKQFRSRAGTATDYCTLSLVRPGYQTRALSVVLKIYRATLPRQLQASDFNAGSGGNTTLDTTYAGARLVTSKHCTKSTKASKNTI